MAFNIHWKILFKSLRAGTVYTVNIWKDGSLPSGYPLTLKGGAEPMTTDEDADEDMFCPVRKQSGYFRIVDDGRARNANGQDVAFDWKTMLPVNDTDRPVTLTDGQGNVVWQGFMQAQNFGSELYGNPQEREFPVQCALTILEGYDINYQQKEIQNFAYLLKYILDSIPCITIDNVIIQNKYANNYLMKRIDWQNFVDEDNDGNLSAKYNLYECLEDMCSFWGWTARTCKKTLYLTCTDSVDGNEGYSFTRQQLNTMAAGTSSGTWVSDIPVINVTGDIFASTENNDFKVRGHNLAQVKADVNRADPDVISTKTDQFKQVTTANGWGDITQGEEGRTRYTNDLLTLTTNLMTGTAVSGKASFNMAHLWDGENASAVEVPLIRMKTGYTGQVYASLQTVYEHGYGANIIRLHSQAYQGYKKMETEVADSSRGDKNMFIHLGIGKTRQTAKWLSVSGENLVWGNSPSDIRMTYNNNDGNAYIVISTSSATIYSVIRVPDDLTGLVFVDFLGTNYGDVRVFDIADFYVSTENDNGSNTVDGFENGKPLGDYQTYKSKNGNNVRSEWNADCIYASENNLPFGYGMVMNQDGTFMQGIHNILSRGEFQEQWQAECVTLYWNDAKRKIETEVRSNINCSLDIGGSIAIGNITPMHRALMDSTTFSPISISHSWRDDVTKIVLLEIPA